MSRATFRARQGVSQAAFVAGVGVPFVMDLLAPFAAVALAIYLAWTGQSAWQAVFLGSTAYCFYALLAGWLTERFSTPVEGMPVAPLPCFVSYSLLLIAHAALGGLPRIRAGTRSAGRDPTVPEMAFRLWLLVAVLPTALVAILQAGGIWLLR